MVIQIIQIIRKAFNGAGCSCITENVFRRGRIPIGCGVESVMSSEDKVKAACRAVSAFGLSAKEARGMLMRFNIEGTTTGRIPVMGTSEKVKCIRCGEAHKDTDAYMRCADMTIIKLSIALVEIHNRAQPYRPDQRGIFRLHESRDRALAGIRETADRALALFEVETGDDKVEH